VVAIIDSGGANIGSVNCALRRLGVKATLTVDHDVIRNADHVILPGVGSARHAMDVLVKNDLVDLIRSLRQPVLGICLGMQLLFDASDEGDSECLGIIPGRCRRFDGTGQIVPHMGWNQLYIVDQREAEYNYPSDANASEAKAGVAPSLLNGIKTGDWTYFVHSYYAPINDCTIASCEYGIRFSAIVNKDNFFAAQFHPERSAATGALLLQNFLNIQS
jgi:glutamine amidotransferase